MTRSQTLQSTILEETLEINLKLINKKFQASFFLGYKKTDIEDSWDLREKI